MIKQLLKKYLGEDEKVNEFLGEMKANGVYVSAQENIDKRYAKLKEDYTGKETELQNTLTQLTQLQQASQGSEELQAQLEAKEKTIATLQAQNVELVKDVNIKMFLLQNHAKADDLDYLMFKLKDEVKTDENGNVTNGEDLMKLASTKYQNQFESSVKKVVDVKGLPNEDENKQTITKEQFDKMNYKQRDNLYNENKELYEKLSKGE